MQNFGNRFGLSHHKSDVVELLAMAEVKHGTNDRFQQLIGAQFAAAMQEFE